MMQDNFAKELQFNGDGIFHMCEYPGSALDNAMKTGILPEGAERSSFLTRYRMLMQDAYNLHKDLDNYFKTRVS